MAPQERAEVIVLATRQDRYAKATVLMDFIASEIEEAERGAIKRELQERLTNLRDNKSYAEGFRAAKEKAKGICEDHWSTPDSEIAKRIGEMKP